MQIYIFVFIIAKFHRIVKHFHSIRQIYMRIQHEIKSKTGQFQGSGVYGIKNNSGLFIILALAAAAGIGGYYYKVILLKKKLEQADDLDDFDFEDEDTETVVNEVEETDE